MAGMGPVSKRNSRRRNSRVGWVQLPAEGRSGLPPEWPISGRVPKRVWLQLWGLPQAVMWEYSVRVVARYARLLISAEKPDASAAILNEVRQLEDRLGVSPVSMRRLQWEIAVPLKAVDDVKVATLADYRDLYGDD